MIGLKKSGNIINPSHGGVLHGEGRFKAAPLLSLQQRVDVVALPDTMYATHTLACSEQHTITCKMAGGVSRVPIPRGTGENVAGLFTLDLFPRASGPGRS